MIPTNADFSTSIQSAGRTYLAIDLPSTVKRLGGDLRAMPFVIRILLENLLRSYCIGGARAVTSEEIELLLNWQDNIGADLPLYVSRVILPDSSGLPVLQDLAAIRDAVARAGGDPKGVDTLVPVDLIVDHSLQVDNWGTTVALAQNMKREFERNAERYSFLGWAKQAYRGLRIFPPGSGIIHQVNLERIASVVGTANEGGKDWAFPDFVIGGDSHTPMINGIGVLGWGVGGIDAEAALLGQAYTFPLPEVVGVRLIGSVQPLVWSTDVALLITQRLRAANVTNCAVEYFGPAAQALTAAERATLANMSPEYGATCGFFPIDSKTLDYLRVTGRSPEHIALVEAYARRVGLFRSADDPTPKYSRIIEIDLGDARPSMAGPSRPQDRLTLEELPQDFKRRLTLPLQEGGFGATAASVPAHDAKSFGQGSIVIAALTSCTNTSNPQVMLAAGLVARNAVARGLQPPSWVKCSLAPGSPTVVKYLESAGLLDPLARLGFQVVGFGCTTCGGKSGPLAKELVEQIEEQKLVTASVLSGNRNFAGRIHKLVRANYIGSPPLVVIYALAGRIDINLEHEPIGRDIQGRGVFWRDILPSQEEVQALIEQLSQRGVLGSAGSDDPADDEPEWYSGNQSGERYSWDPKSLYLREPPFFSGSDGSGVAALVRALSSTRVLGAFGDSLTTDHISPGGEIPADSPAGQYLIAAGVAPRDFNTYVGRRGNAEVMVRGTFANIRLRNALTPDCEGGWTLHFPDRSVTTIYDASRQYMREGVAAIILGGKEYGTGSSRDWAAKGAALLGIKAVIAESYERIHRANLIGMGILPLRFADGEGWRQLGLDGSETYAFANVENGILKGEPITVTATKSDGATIRFAAQAETRTTAERHLIAAGGIYNSVLQGLLQQTPA